VIGGLVRVALVTPERHEARLPRALSGILPAARCP
jgi:hypothetical protein